MNQPLLYKRFLLCLIMLFSLSSLTVTAEEVKQDSESEIENELELFLWFADLEADQAAILADKDPDELEQALESTEKLFAKQNEEHTEKTSIPSSAFDSEK